MKGTHDELEDGEEGHQVAKQRKGTKVREELLKGRAELVRGVPGIQSLEVVVEA